MSKILLIGCGAISRMLYLPFFCAEGRWYGQVTAVDIAKRNIDEAGTFEGIRFVQGDYEKFLGGATLAIVATPPDSHFEIAARCLNAGAHVILEKPLTSTYPEAVELVRRAQERGRLLMVNNTRRLFQSYQEIQRILASGQLGRLLEIEYSEGGAFAWPTASGFYFDSTRGGRGVISDRGSHVLDLFCWWSGGNLELDECRVDADGGVEGFCDVRLVLPQGSARMRLSWHNKLANRVRIRCEGGDITTGIYDFREIRLTRGSRSERRVLAAEEKVFEEYGMTFVRRSVAAAFEKSEPPVRGADVLLSLNLIDECYRRAERIDFPWLYQHSPKA